MEAAMVLPLTVLIMAALIGLMITFFMEFQQQVQNHREERDRLYETQETHRIRIADRIRDGGEEVMAR